MLAPRRRPAVPESGRRCRAGRGHQGSHTRRPTAPPRTTPGPTRDRRVLPARMRRRQREGAQVGRFSGFQNSRFPRMHHAHR